MCSVHAVRVSNVQITQNQTLPSQITFKAASLSQVKCILVTLILSSKKTAFSAYIGSRQSIFRTFTNDLRFEYTVHRQYLEAKVNLAS